MLAFLCKHRCYSETGYQITINEKYDRFWEASLQIISNKVFKTPYHAGKPVQILITRLLF